MKEIIRIHIARTPYSIEANAKKELKKYLTTIQEVMDGADEVMQEIEARIVELLAERGVQAEGVITAADVTAVQKQMGEPREFSDGESEDKAEELASHRPEKRLMRDMDNALIGGVCAGIAAYWGVNPLWVRLLALFSPFVSFGTSVAVYVVMWLIVPAAHTAAGKLQMRGEAVTLSSLKETTISQPVMKGVTTAAKVFRFLLGTILLIGTMGVLISLVVGSAVGLSVVTGMRGFMAQPWAWGLLISLMIGGVVAVWLGATLTYSAFSWTLKKPAIVSIITAVVIGALCISTTTFLGIRTADELGRDEKRLTKVLSLPVPVGDHELRTVENRASHASVYLRHTTEEPRVEVRYVEVSDAPVPHITLSREGGRLIIHGTESPQQCDSLSRFFTLTGGCYGSSPKVIVYGNKLRMEHGSLRYGDWEIPDQD